MTSVHLARLNAVTNSLVWKAVLVNINGLFTTPNQRPRADQHLPQIVQQAGEIASASRPRAAHAAIAFGWRAPDPAVPSQGLHLGERQVPVLEQRCTRGPEHCLSDAVRWSRSTMASQPKGTQHQFSRYCQISNPFNHKTAIFAQQSQKLGMQSPSSAGKLELSLARNSLAGSDESHWL